MSLPNRSRFVYNDGAGVDFFMLLPARQWLPASKGHGESDTSASGIPAHFEVRRDARLHLPLRFFESEWPSVRRLVEHGQRSGSATWYPDMDVSGTSFTVYVDEPAMGDEIIPRPSEHAGVLELDIVLRRTTSGQMEPVYYEADS